MGATDTLSAERLLRRLEWRVVKRLDGRLQGDYRSLFRGSGVDFTDLREYEPGDDLRHIEWNVTARLDEPYVREYVEERELTAWLLLDHSASMGFGPVDRQKDLVLAEVATTLAHVLTRGGSRGGAIVMDTGVDAVLPPGAGRTQALRLAETLSARRAERAADDEAAAGAAGSGRGWLGRRRAATAGGPGTGRTAFGRRAPAPARGAVTDLSVLLSAAAGIAR